MVMVGLKDDPTYGTMWKDLDDTNCAEYRHYPDLVIGAPGSRIGFSSGTDLYRCPTGSVLVTLIDDDWKFNTPTSMQCAPVQGPYTVDTSDCAILPIDDPAAMQSSTSDTSE
ncbi:hypothetical protein FJT64_022032 [Amphibalanus amphitrite]|uniref:Uncharacterized protein n=1 Tax=Amphibalanus amphitrite TaxID=1232801 RepID=A0A6A4WRS1_AMPAM|nr:hypothetical protein FJT64_022032 [Amphibalanus amphitrite]